MTAVSDHAVWFLIAGGPNSTGQPGTIGWRIPEIGWFNFVTRRVLPYAGAVRRVIFHNPFGTWYDEMHYDQRDVCRDRAPTTCHADFQAAMAVVLANFEAVDLYMGEISTTTTVGGPQVAWEDPNTGGLSTTKNEIHRRSIPSPFGHPCTFPTYHAWAQDQVIDLVENGCRIIVGIGGDGVPSESNPGRFLEYARNEFATGIGIEPVPPLSTPNLNRPGICTLTAFDRYKWMLDRGYAGLVRPEHLVGERTIIWNGTAPTITKPQLERMVEDGWRVALRPADVDRLSRV
jgi:hypothetical protein